MLAKAARITRGADYRATVRRGRRFTDANTVTYARRNPETNGVRFGFIVSKAVGNAVHRNRVRRRLKAAAYEELRQLPVSALSVRGVDIVIRALPASAQATWDSLHQEVSRAVDHLLIRQSDGQRTQRHSVTSEGNVRS